MKLILLTVCLVAGVACVVVGVSLWSPPAAWIAAGAGVAGLGVLCFAGDG